MGWRVRKERPEEKYGGEAREYYSGEGGLYEKNAIRHIQEKILLRGLRLIQFPANSRILDAGCGTGMGMEILRGLGYAAEGIDISEGLLKIAERKKLRVKFGDMREIPFKGSAFDGIISISALQWISARKGPEGKSDLKKAAAEFFRVLKKGGKALVQFYPKSEAEMLTAGQIFREAGFGVKIQVDNESNPRKRRIYLLLQK